MGFSDPAPHPLILLKRDSQRRFPRCPGMRHSPERDSGRLVYRLTILKNALSSSFLAGSRLCQRTPWMAPSRAKSIFRQAPGSMALTRRNAFSVPADFSSKGVWIPAWINFSARFLPTLGICARSSNGVFTGSLPFQCRQRATSHPYCHRRSCQF